MSSDSDASLLAPSSLWPTAKLPLASLTPESATALAFLNGVVTLLWPFSSSSSTLSLLICEEDFRLRCSKGQLRVNFRGAAARAVDSKKVQIGDMCQLSLEGAELEVLEDATPRDVPWALVFSGRLVMKFKNSTGWDCIDVNAPDELMEPLSSTILGGGSLYEHASPVPALTTPPPGENLWSFKRKGDLIANSPLYLQRLFDEEDDGLDVDLERPRKRPRFSSGSYRLVDRTPSPESESGNGETTQDMYPDTSNDDIEASRLAAMTDGPLEIYRDPPSAGKVPRNHPMWIDMPPPPPPHQQNNEDESDIPDSPSLRPIPSSQLPLVSPFFHRGLAEDYLSIDPSGQGEFAWLDSESIPTAALEVEAPPPMEGTAPEQMGRSEDGHSPALSATECSRPTSSAGESEIDSLFDEVSDMEDARPRHRSRSPLPGPSPLRRVERAKTPERSPAMKSKLSIQTNASPLQTRDVSTPKTPHLYLPTPSPKIENSHNLGFPFTAPSRLDFGMMRPSEKGKGKADDTPLGQKWKLLRQSLDSAPADLSTYFGRSRHDAAGQPRELGPAWMSEKDSITDAPTTSVTDEEEGRQVRREVMHRQRSESFMQFKSGITTPLSDFPPLAFLSWGTTVDIIGVVCQSTSIVRAESGQKDYYMAVRIVDSSNPSGIITRLFRPYKDALPEVDVGDVVMLRSFKITSHKHRFVGVSTENSAWAVWKNHGKKRPAVCAGPPVEYGDEEEEYADNIGMWYARLDAKIREGMERKPREELVAGIE